MEIDLVSPMDLLLISCRKLKLFNTENPYSTLVIGPCVPQPAVRTRGIPAGKSAEPHTGAFS